MAPMDVDTVLVPVDGSDESTRAVEYALAIASSYGASVHAMYVLGDEATRAIDRGAVNPDDVAAENGSYVDALDDVAGPTDVPITHSVAYGFSARRKLVHPGNVVLDAAEQMTADFLVIPREGGQESTDVLEKTAEYVLLYASQPVLSV